MEVRVFFVSSDRKTCQYMRVKWNRLCCEDSPVMTTATKTEPTKTARHDSHHVSPRVTKLETVAQDAYSKRQYDARMMAVHP
jgi:hypothetical protein